jgi:predicted small lipoprotein YifL
MIPTPRIIALFLNLALLSACGLKGPLYMPPPEPAEKPAPAQPAKKPDAQTAPNASQPAPANAK